jgi:hypothetical protein
LYKCANLQKILVLGEYLFQGSKQNSMDQFPDRQSSEFA